MDELYFILINDYLNNKLSLILRIIHLYIINYEIFIEKWIIERCSQINIKILFEKLFPNNFERWDKGSFESEYI